MEENSRIYVAGHRGLVGSAIWRQLEARGHRQLHGRIRPELDLRDWEQTRAFFEEVRPEYVLNAAGKVGGIHANNQLPVDFLEDNLRMEINLVRAAHEFGVKRFLFLGSSCIYPREAENPISEDALLSGALEKTNEPYAIAKITGIQLCDAYRRQHGSDFFSVMPCNLYGPGDNYHPENSHVLPAMIRRFHEAKESRAPEVVCWGSGTPRREFMFCDDLGDACCFLMDLPEVPNIINVGYGKDISIRELAELVADVVGFEGGIEWDSTRPDGTIRKLIDSQRVRELGWSPKTGLREGLEITYKAFLASKVVREK